jgi:hypothetical protein
MSSPIPVACARFAGAGPASASAAASRIVYSYHDDTMPLFLLLTYAKTQRENWTGDEKRRAQALTESIKQTYRRH